MLCDIDAELWNNKLRNVAVGTSKRLVHTSCGFQHPESAEQLRIFAGLTAEVTADAVLRVGCLT